MTSGAVITASPLSAAGWRRRKSGGCRKQWHWRGPRSSLAARRARRTEVSQPARLDRLFDGLLRLLPQDLRERHGREIAQVYRAERDEAPTRAGRMAVSLRTAAGVVAAALPEHLSILDHDVRHAVR